MSSLRVALDARLSDGSSGGVQQFALGLFYGLNTISDPDEEYLVLTYEGQEDWLKPYISDQFRMIPHSLPATGRVGTVKKQLDNHAPWVRQVWEHLPRPVPGVARSNGRIELERADVMHFTNQAAFATDIPTIYQPHDLQHIHLPQFFTRQERKFRNALYREACERANLVAVSSTWVKNDLITHFGIAANKIAVIPPAPLLSAYPQPTDEDRRVAKMKFGLPDRFLFYPAQTWPHKNHISLINAVAQSKALSHEQINVVFSGRRNDYSSEIDRAVRRLGLTDQVIFTDFVTPVELQSLYELARAVVIPTLFEAASFPMWEAFQAKVPVACSNVTSLPAQAGNAALIFDPLDVEAIATAITRLWNDDDLCAALVQKGQESVSRFTWASTASKFRAYYRLLGGRQISEDDRKLIEAVPIL